jgi:hypothetical protein
MPTPSVTFKNSSDLYVEWGHYYQKGGPVARYELKIMNLALSDTKIIAVDKSNNRVDISLNGTDGLQWAPDCLNLLNGTTPLSFSIRAVTYDESNGEYYDGAWSHQEDQSAYCKGKKSSLSHFNFALHFISSIYQRKSISYKIR